MEPGLPELLCPSDATPLSIRESSESWYGLCERCGGVWIGRPEMDRLVESASSPPVSYPDEEFQILEGTALCPCGADGPMDRITREEVSIDLCPSCQAIWFDAGEIQCILAAEREAVLRKGLPPTPELLPRQEPAGPWEEASRVFDLFDAILFVARLFGRALG